MDLKYQKSWGDYWRVCSEKVEGVDDIIIISKIQRKIKMNCGSLKHKHEWLFIEKNHKLYLNKSAQPTQFSHHVIEFLFHIISTIGI